MRLATCLDKRLLRRYGRVLTADENERVKRCVNKEAGRVKPRAAGKKTIEKESRR